MRLLAWMSGRAFPEIVANGLLGDVEGIVVEGHRTLFESEGRAWSPPVAYHWLRYEDPDPVNRLREGVRALRRKRAQFDSSAVEKACAKAAESGFLI